MAEKLYEYQGFLGRIHQTRDEYKEKWIRFKENRGGLTEAIKDKFWAKGQDRRYSENEDFSHIYRWVYFSNPKIKMFVP